MSVLAELDRFSDERFLALYEALSDRGFGPLDGEVAKALKFRPQAIKKLPFEKRARHAQALMKRGQNAELCYEFFGSYLVKTKRDLVTTFLDKTGVPHEEGLIADGEDAQPAPEKVEQAVTDLDLAFEPDDVTLYLALALEQWPEHEKLREVYRRRVETARA
ncbi:MAG: hypothetical protein WD226_01965 [Planctomycetota bacterium]